MENNELRTDGCALPHWSKEMSFSEEDVGRHLFYAYTRKQKIMARSRTARSREMPVLEIDSKATERILQSTWNRQNETYRHNTFVVAR